MHAALPSGRGASRASTPEGLRRHDRGDRRVGAHGTATVPKRGTYPGSGRRARVDRSRRSWPRVVCQRQGGTVADSQGILQDVLTHKRQCGYAERYSGLGAGGLFRIDGCRLKMVFAHGTCGSDREYRLRVRSIFCACLERLPRRVPETKSEGLCFPYFHQSPDDARTTRIRSYQRNKPWSGGNDNQRDRCDAGHVSAAST